MDQNEPVLSCVASVEWLNKNEQTVRKISYKNAMLRILRNDLKELFVEVQGEKVTTTKLKLKNINVHKKFMSEGKASIKFIDENVSIYVSNAPPGTLMAFLRIIFIKLTSDKANNQELTKEEVQKKIRAHILSENPNKFDEISPITNAELSRAKKMAISKSTVTTPSPPQNKKRRLEHNSEQPGAAKKLYAPSPLSARPKDIAQLEVLNAEQNTVLQACLAGKNVFFTGSAGTGKSFLLRKIISTLPPDGTVATASTGVAACLVGGVTLHSFAGIGSGEFAFARSLQLASRPAAAQAWRKCKRLIIDEISMVDGDFFDKIEKIAREVRRNDKPFGGLQLILCGDFFQLPPVIKQEFSKFQQQPQTPPPKQFCFQSSSWEQCIQVSYELKQVHRQKDPEFIDILNSIRIGRVTTEIADRLMATSRQKIESGGILATQLCSHTKDADAINQSKLDNLESPEKLFEALDSDIYLTKTLDAQLPVPYKLVLKIGAQVMLLKNISVASGLVNGARGVVVRYDEGVPVVKFKNREYAAKSEKWIIKTPSGGILTRKQIPLKLAWAFSIHKSQGLTLDCVEMSLSKVFEAGQAYVALSRAQGLDTIRIIDFDAKQVWANPNVLRFYKAFRRQFLDVQYIPLGEKKSKNKTDLKRTISGMKLTKKMMEQPLLTIG